jgi:hypothetical protein
MKMKRGERRHVGETLERQHLAEMRANVIDDAVDSLLVFKAVGFHPRYNLLHERRRAPDAEG